MNISILTSDKPLKVRLKQVSDGKAELVFSDSQSVVINARFLPPCTKAGDQLILNLMTEEDLSKTKKEIAREVLRDILQK